MVSVRGRNIGTPNLFLGSLDSDHINKALGAPNLDKVGLCRSQHRYKCVQYAYKLDRNRLPTSTRQSQRYNCCFDNLGLPLHHPSAFSSLSSHWSLLLRRPAKIIDIFIGPFARGRTRLRVPHTFRSDRLLGEHWEVPVPEQREEGKPEPQFSCKPATSRNVSPPIIRCQTIKAFFTERHSAELRGQKLLEGFCLLAESFLCRTRETQDHGRHIWL